MLQKYNLDDLTFQQLMDTAQQTVSRYASEWSGANTHDPGIMLLELIAWITEMQQYYVNEKANLQAVFPLLGVVQKPAQAASSVISILPENEGTAMRLPKGTSCYAQSICFETMQPTWSGIFQITAIQNNKKTYSLQEQNIYPFGQSPQGGETCSVLLKTPLLLKVEYRLWFRVRQGIGVRNTGTPPKLAHVQWEYLSMDGYQPLQVTDGTFGFTMSGMVSFQLPAPMEKDENGYYVLRARLIMQEYEVQPCIEAILPCASEVEQKETMCEDLVLTFDGLSYQADSFLSQTQESLLYEVTDDVYQRIENFERRKNKNEVSYIVPNIHSISKATLHALSASDKFLLRRKLGSADGFANQSFRVDVQNERILGDTFSLLVFEDETLQNARKWCVVPNFHQSSANSLHFLLDCDTGDIKFGDGIHGAMPYGVVFVASMALTKAENGNIAADQIQSLSYQGNRYLVHQPSPAQGGSPPQTSAQAFAEWREAISCAATEEDISRLVFRVPGLMIEAVNVFSLGASREGLDEVSHIGIAVKPYGSHKPLSGAYQMKIREYLEPYRMLGTRYHILSPKYINFEITVELEAYPRNYAIIKQLQAKIKHFFIKQYHVFGAHIKRMELVRFLLAQEGVVRIVSLEYKASDDMIQEKKQNGDCILRPDAIAYPGSVTVLMR